MCGCAESIFYLTESYKRAPERVRGIQQCDDLCFRFDLILLQTLLSFYSTVTLRDCVTFQMVTRPQSSQILRGPSVPEHFSATPLRILY